MMSLSSDSRAVLVVWISQIPHEYILMESYVYSDCLSSTNDVGYIINADADPNSMSDLVCITIVR